ncbi:MAG: hypothetical protein EOP05_09085, partial [Proteobacteria bacterium]
MLSRKTAILIAAVAAIQSLPCLCAAGITSRPNFYKRLKLNLERDFSRGLDASTIQPIESRNITTSADVAKMIPCESLQATNDGARVAGQIAERSLRAIMNSDNVKKSSLARTAASVEEIGGGDMAIGGDEPDSVQHKIKFAMRPTQTRAMLSYAGFTNAQVSYRASESKFDVEVREPVDLIATDVVLNHISV